MQFSAAAVLCLTFLCAHGNPLPDAQQPSSAATTHPLTNQDVVRMTKASFDDATILKTIESHNASFDLSVDALLRLKELGVSRPVIQAMLAAEPDRKPIAAAPARAAAFTVKPAESSLFPEEVGVFPIVKGKLIAVEPEIVNWQTGGVVKKLLSFDTLTHTWFRRFHYLLPFQSLPHT
jgi:hypothetical protein